MRIPARFRRFMDVLTSHRHRSDCLSAELDRIASDPDTRALFRAELDHAIAEHIADVAELVAFTEAVAEVLRSTAIQPPSTEERAS